MNIIEVNQILGTKRNKYANLFNTEISKYNPDAHYPSGHRAEKIFRIYRIYKFYQSFSPHR